MCEYGTIYISTQNKPLRIIIMSDTKTTSLTALFWDKFITKTNVELADLPDRCKGGNGSFLKGMVATKAQDFLADDSEVSEDSEDWVTAETIDGAVFAYPNVERTLNMENPMNYGSAPNMDAQAFGLIVSMIVYSHASFGFYESNPQLSEVMGNNYHKLRTSFYELLDAALYPDEIADDADDETTTRIAWFSELTEEQKEALGVMSQGIYSITD